jgi:hypothetical protein
VLALSGLVAGSIFDDDSLDLLSFFDFRKDLDLMLLRIFMVPLDKDVKDPHLLFQSSLNNNTNCRNDRNNRSDRH